MTFNTPTLLWSQTPESIDISIRLSNIENESVSCENNHFYFSCSSQSKDYWIEFDLDKAVEKISYNKYKYNDKYHCNIFNANDTGRTFFIAHLYYIIYIMTT